MRDIAVVEFEDGFCIAVNAEAWWKEISSEAVRLHRRGNVRVFLFNRDVFNQPILAECLYARV